MRCSAGVHNFCLLCPCPVSFLSSLIRVYMYLLCIYPHMYVPGVWRECGAYGVLCDIYCHLTVTKFRDKHTPSHLYVVCTLRHKMDGRTRGQGPGAKWEGQLTDCPKTQKQKNEQLRAAPQHHFDLIV